MKQPEHLTEEQFTLYHSRRLGTVELLAVDEHITTCDACRDRLYRQEQTGTQIRQLRADLAGHLEYDQIAACAHGLFPPEAAQHLKECDMCQAEVDDLRRFRTEIESAPRGPIQMPARRIPWRLAAAAALLLAAGTTVWLVRQGQAPATQVAVFVPQKMPTEAPLSAEQDQALQLALSTNKLERAPILDRLIAKRGILMGSPGDAKEFEVVGPMGTTVLGDRPTFHWNPAAGATRYTVAVFDENFEKVVESPEVSGTEWQPEQPLARGRIYNWQVNTIIGGKPVHAPTPPAPEARFLVVDAEAAQRIEAARREHPGNHLLLAALYAKAGAVEEAGKELDQLADRAAAETLRQSLK